MKDKTEQDVFQNIYITDRQNLCPIFRVRRRNVNTTDDCMMNNSDKGALTYLIACIVLGDDFFKTAAL